MKLHGVVHKLVPLRDLGWSLVSPALDEHRELIISTVNLHSDAAWSLDATWAEEDPESLPKRVKHRPFRPTLLR